jgi:hypothetical protein
MGDTEVAGEHARSVLASYMTAAQRTAFARPCITMEAAQDGRYNRIVDEQPGDTAWRVCVIVDASPHTPERWPCWHVTLVWGELRKGLAGPARAVFEYARDVPRIGLAAGDIPAPETRWITGGPRSWPNMRFRKAEALMRHELAGVGNEGSLTISTREALEAGARALGLLPHEVRGVSGRCRLTLQEACSCLSRGALAAIDPGILMLTGDPAAPIHP